MRPLLFCCSFLWATVPAWTQSETNSLAAPTFPVATFTNVSYGPHPRNVLDFWQAPSAKPTPLLLYIHGGGWYVGDKSAVPVRTLRFLLKNGISVASINYRYSTNASLPAPVYDAARALQFIRSKAVDWHLKKQRVAAMGVSAGACTSLWLAYHDDLAQPNSEDRVARESTRLCAAVALIGQTAIDPELVIPWTGEQIANHLMIPWSVGATNYNEVKARYADFRDLYREFSPINHVSAGDPPVFLFYSDPTPLPAGNPSLAIHHAILGQKLKQKADATGLICELHYSGTSKPDQDSPAISEFLLRQFGKHKKLITRK